MFCHRELNLDQITEIINNNRHKNIVIIDDTSSDIPKVYVDKFFSEIKIKKEIKDIILSFIENNNINHKTLGVHLRTTDAINENL